MIVWLNGTFGVGKTTAAKALVGLLPDSRIFDPERIGFMLRHVLATEQVDDFQDWQPWRELVVATARQVLNYVGGTLVVPQSVLVRQYWQEIRDGLAEARISVRHVVLHATPDELVRRIQADTVEVGARRWRLVHLQAYEAALPWLNQDAEIVDTTGLPPEHVAALLYAQPPGVRSAHCSNAAESGERSSPPGIRSVR